MVRIGRRIYRDDPLMLPLPIIKPRPYGIFRQNLFYLIRPFYHDKVLWVFENFMEAQREEIVWLLNAVAINVPNPRREHCFVARAVQVKWLHKNERRGKNSIFDSERTREPLYQCCFTRAERTCERKHSSTGGTR